MGYLPVARAGRDLCCASGPPGPAVLTGLGFTRDTLVGALDDAAPPPATEGGAQLPPTVEPQE